MGYWWPLYYSGVVDSREFLDVLPDVVTLHNDLPRCSWAQTRSGEATIFKEVVVKNKCLYSEAADLINEKVQSATLDELFEEIKRVIAKSWEIDKQHVVSHSSGYDSRVISAAIKSLAQERGADWLGDTVFVEVLGEGPEFMEIMKRLGFVNYLAYNDHIDSGMYHWYSFGFEDYYKKYNGVVGFPVNVWYDAYKHCRGIFKEDAQFFGGYGSNAIGNISLRGYFRMQSKQQMQFMRMWFDDVHFPFWDYGVIRKMLGVKKTIGRRRVTEVLSKHVSPELDNIPRLSVEQFSMRGVRKMDDYIVDEAQSAYDRSWYGKKFPMRINPNFYTYNECWGHYGAASLCDHLLSAGYKILT